MPQKLTIAAWCTVIRPVTVRRGVLGEVARSFSGKAGRFMSVPAKKSPPLASRVIQIFFMAAIIFYQGSLCSTQTEARDWSRVRSADTLDLYSNGKYAGSMMHSLAVDTVGRKIIDETRLHITSNGLSDAEIATMEIFEQRQFGFDGNLFSADQELKSPAGTNRWRLEKEKQNGWKLSVTAGGATRVRRIEKLSENLAMTYALYTGIKKRAVKPGDMFHDTVIDLTSGGVCFTKVTCRETPSIKNNFVWVFGVVNNLTTRDERWELDTIGMTLYQELWPFVVRRKNASRGAKHQPAPALFEALAVPASRPAGNNESIGLVLDSSMTPDSSVSRFYVRNGKTWVLRNVAAGCTGKPSSAAEDSSMATFIAPTATMQSGDGRIIKLSDSLVKGKKGRCDSIRACFEYVNKTLIKRYSPTFSSALETLSAGFGDCGEHAVLLGALLRAARIPARIALGLVYVNGREGYFYHAWVMAYAGDAWVFIDPALGVFPATRDRVPLVIDDTGSAVIGIAKMLGKIKIEYVKR